MSLALEKMHKAMDSLMRAMQNYKEGNKRASIGDIHYVQDNCEEAICLLLAELDEMSSDIK